MKCFSGQERWQVWRYHHSHQLVVWIVGTLLPCYQASLCNGSALIQKSNPFPGSAWQAFLLRFVSAGRAQVSAHATASHPPPMCLPLGSLSCRGRVLEPHTGFLSVSKSRRCQELTHLDAGLPCRGACWKQGAEEMKLSCFSEGAPSKVCDMPSSNDIVFFSRPFSLSKKGIGKMTCTFSVPF